MIAYCTLFVNDYILHFMRKAMQIALRVYGIAYCTLCVQHCTCIAICVCGIEHFTLCIWLHFALSFTDCILHFVCIILCIALCVCGLQILLCVLCSVSKWLHNAHSLSYLPFICQQQLQHFVSLLFTRFISSHCICQIICI